MLQQRAANGAHARGHAMWPRNRGFRRRRQCTAPQQQSRWFTFLPPFFFRPPVFVLPGRGCVSRPRFSAALSLCLYAAFERRAFFLLLARSCCLPGPDIAGFWPSPWSSPCAPKLARAVVSCFGSRFGFSALIVGFRLFCLFARPHLRPICQLALFFI